MNTASTIICKSSASVASLDDDVLVWLWERQEAGRTRDLRALRQELAHSFPSLTESSLDKLFREFAALANFSAMADGVAESRPEVLQITSFSHYKIVDSEDPTTVRRGGLASVHKAIDTRFDRSIAIKVPLQRFAKDAEVCARLEREAAISASLQHPNIVPIYEIGVYEPVGCPFFAMKYVEGATLLHCMGSESPQFSELRLLRAIREVCSALEHAHANGVVHRDVKPENVMIGEFGEVHLLDWGFARSAHAGDGSLTARRRMMERFFQTATSGVFGTLAYMSPEQAQGRTDAVSSKSDVFGVGGILCHLLAGRPVYSGPQDALLKMAINCETEAALKFLDATKAARDLKSLVRSCLDPLPDLRPTIHEVGQRIDSWLESLEQARFKAEQRARHMTIAFAGSIVVLVFILTGMVLFKQYQKSVISESMDAAAVEAQASMLLDHAVKTQRQAMRKVTNDRNEEQIPLLDEAERLAGESLSIAQPISAMPEIVQRAETLLRDIRNDRAFAELRSKDLRLKAIGAERDEKLIANLSQGMDADESIFVECLSGVWIDIPPETRSHAFQRAFADYGIDWNALGVDEINSLLVARPNDWRSQLCSWLDLWVHDAARLRSSSLAKKIVAVQNGIEPVAARTQFRKTLSDTSKDIQADLLNVVSSEDARSSSPPDLALGIKLLENRENDLGVRFLRKAALANPQNEIANAVAGVYLSNRNAAENDSINFLNVWRALAPKRGQLLVALLTKSGRETDAIAICQSIRTAGGMSPELSLLESLCWSRLGEDQKGLASIRSIKHTTNETVLTRLGLPIALLSLGRIDEAESAIAIRIESHPDEKLLYLAKGMIYQRGGNSTIAEASFHTFLDSLLIGNDEKSSTLVALRARVSKRIKDEPKRTTP